MTKYEFLARLEAALSALEPEERREALRYYEEYFEDDTEAAEKLGSPEKIAADLLASYGIDPDRIPPSEPVQPAATAETSPGRIVGAILLYILAFILGSVAFGLICGATVTAVVAIVMMQFSGALGVTVLGAAILVLGLFGLSLGGTIKSAVGAASLLKHHKGGAEV